MSDQTKNDTEREGAMSQPVADAFREMLALSRDRRTTDAIMDAVFEAKLFKTGTPDHAKFYFEDGSGLALDSYDDSDHQRMWTFDWEAR